MTTNTFDLEATFKKFEIGKQLVRRDAEVEREDVVDHRHAERARARRERGFQARAAVAHLGPEGDRKQTFK